MSNELKLSEEEFSILANAIKTDIRPEVRIRAAALRMLAQGHSLESVTSVFAVTPQTIRRWKNRWEEGALNSLADAARSEFPSDKLAVQVWLRAGGICQYRGCPERLWEDKHTLRQMNAAYLAHIIAESENGPRGHPELSEKLKNSPENVMLMCDVHHRLIDFEDVGGHPVELLTRWKQEHEQRIKLLTSVREDLHTQILFFGSRIGMRQAMFSYEQAVEAILPQRFPTDRTGYEIDLTSLTLNERDSEYWPVIQKEIVRKVHLLMDQQTGPSGRKFSHLSIFALAPIPALIYFGNQIGDIINADVYQRHRDTCDWKWQKLDERDFRYILEGSEDYEENSTIVAVNLSLSGEIHLSEITSILGNEIPIYKLTIDYPRLDFLKAEVQLERFREHWRALLTEIRTRHGSMCQIHLFPAIPNSIAVEVGRVFLPSADPQTVIYNKTDGGAFRPTITVRGKETSYERTTSIYSYSACRSNGC